MWNHIYSKGGLDGICIVGQVAFSLTPLLSSAGDFGTAVEISVSKRNSKERGDISVAEVNRSLDDLNATLDKKEKARILSKLLRRTTANELKWIVRTIIKDMKMGVSEKSILKLLHPEALDMFNVCSNLRTVCEKLKWTPNATRKSDVFVFISFHFIHIPAAAVPSKGKYTVALFTPLKPMLASRKNMDETLRLITMASYQIEVKYDGERLHCHKQGKTLRLFSRYEEHGGGVVIYDKVLL